MKKTPSHLNPSSCRNRSNGTRLVRWKQKNALNRHLFEGALREINTVMQECMGRDNTRFRGGWFMTRVSDTSPRPKCGFYCR